ncbi:hypothetical protein [Riemerella columbina]|uniref:hypothetical protein n=1 Tax=Riemerella columbina TaxID=103810 RepID=UPI000373552E|nr:hypothetical protein [Riemerella columbina]
MDKQLYYTGKRDQPKFYLFLILVTLLIKTPFLFTHHIQEDAFITWNVAQNLLDYGVIGFNGTEPISASTTHLYVFISALIQWLSGDAFVYTIQLFNSLMFGLGSLFLAQVFFSERSKIFLFVVLLNLIPPAIMASVLGMEYGILFLLYCIFIKYAIKEGTKLCFFILPILLIWTRLDTVIFLGIFGLYTIIITRRINPYFFFGGVIGILSVLTFNYWYFGDIVNHTIVAKKIAYPNNKGFDFNEFINQLAYYGGYLRMSGTITMVLFYTYFVLTLCLLFFVLNKEVYKKRIHIIITILSFATAKILIFVFLRAYFDWYYWLPRVFMASIWIYVLIEFVLKTKTLKILSVFIFIAFASFQYIQSLSIGYMENTQRMQIVRDLKSLNANKNQSIVLEPAGKIPFYTRLKTWDEVGLVDKKMTNEMIANFDEAWINLINHNNPTYVLTIGAKAGENKLYKMTPAQQNDFNKKYKLIKSYPIDQVHKSAPYPINIVYSIRAIGQDYYLYKRVEH